MRKDSIMTNHESAPSLTEVYDQLLNAISTSRGVVLACQAAAGQIDGEAMSEALASAVTLLHDARQLLDDNGEPFDHLPAAQ
jgi:hypothetical protein